MASASSGGCARRSNFISAIAGSAVSNSKTRFLIIRRSRSIATRALMGTPEFAKSRNERKKVEMRFAHLKTHHGFERMRLRGFSGARDEFHLAAIVQNLKTLANHIWRPLLNTPTACLA